MNKLVFEMLVKIFFLGTLSTPVYLLTTFIFACLAMWCEKEDYLSDSTKCHLGSSILKNKGLKLIFSSPKNAQKSSLFSLERL